MSPRLHAITLALALALAAASCTANRRRTPDDTIVVVIETAMTTADPRFTLTNYDAKLSKLVAAGLTAVDTPTLEPRLELASKVERVDDLTVDVTLRPEARFSDGSQVTADDVARTYQSVLAADSDSVAHGGFIERFRTVDAIAPDRVRFHLVAPLATLMTDLDFGILSFHAVPPGGALPSRGVIGAGPFVLRTLTSTAARLDANPYYLGGPARTPHVEIRFVGDAAARTLMLVGGSADLIQNAVRLDLVDEVAQRPRVRVAAGPSVLLTYLMMNNTDPVLRDLRVRQAIALALDRPAIIAAKFSGRAVLATGLLPPSHWAYAADMPRWERDLPRARKLLDDAGLPADAAGVRLRLVYKTSADAFRVSVAHVIAAQLGEIGIDVELRPFEFGTFFSDIKKGNFQLASMQTSDITDPDFYFTYFHSSRIPSATDPNAGNRWRYRNLDVDRWTEAGRHELDPVRRKQIYGDVQRQIARDVPIVPLWHEDVVVLTNVDVQGYTIVPNARLVGLAVATKQR